MVSVRVGKYASVTYWHWFWNVAFKSTFYSGKEFGQE